MEGVWERGCNQWRVCGREGVISGGCERVSVCR